MRVKVSINKRDAAASGLLCLLGLAAALQVSAGSLGKLSMMSLGWVPVLLGTLMMFVGILWLFESRLSPDDDDSTDIGSSKWRGSCGLVSGVFAFMVLGKYGGLLPAIAVSVFITVMGDPRHSWQSAALLAAVLTVVAAICLFFLPLPMFRWA